jgi:hypothetical protein
MAQMWKLPLFSPCQSRFDDIFGLCGRGNLRTLKAACAQVFDSLITSSFRRKDVGITPGVCHCDRPLTAAFVDFWDSLVRALPAAAGEPWNTCIANSAEHTNVGITPVVCNFNRKCQPVLCLHLGQAITRGTVLSGIVSVADVRT